MGELDTFSFDLFKEDDDTYIDIFASIDKGKFKSNGKSNRKKINQLGSEWNGSAKRISNLGLFPNARYSLEEVLPNRFKIIFDSVIDLLM